MQVPIDPSHLWRRRRRTPSSHLDLARTSPPNSIKHTISGRRAWRQQLRRLQVWVVGIKDATATTDKTRTACGCLFFSIGYLSLRPTCLLPTLVERTDGRLFMLERERGFIGWEIASVDFSTCQMVNVVNSLIFPPVVCCRCYRSGVARLSYTSPRYVMLYLGAISDEIETAIQRLRL